MLLIHSVISAKHFRRKSSRPVENLPASNDLERFPVVIDRVSIIYPPLIAALGGRVYHLLYEFLHSNHALEFLMASIRLAVNGRTFTVDADRQTSLLTVLRELLDLTGTKYGCGEGQCGACTVLIDGRAQRSCITNASTVTQKQITTIEGLANGDRLHPLQEAFLAEGALQCGYCTPGMIMSAAALLSRNHNPTATDIVDAMDGNICRCGTYSRIITAIQRAAKTPTASTGGTR